MPLDAKTKRWGVGRKTRPLGSQTKNVGEDGGSVIESRYWMQKEVGGSIMRESIPLERKEDGLVCTSQCCWREKRRVEAEVGGVRESMPFGEGARKA